MRHAVYLTFGRRPAQATLYRMLNDGRITAHRIGNRWLIPTEAAQRFIRTCGAGEKY